MVEVINATRDNTMTLDSDIFKRIFFDSGFLGRLITQPDDKKHKKNLTDEEWQRMEYIVGLLYDEFDINVRMNMVSDHWHGHIIPEGEKRDLSDE